MAKHTTTSRSSTGPRGPQKLANVIADVMIRRGYARQVASSQFQEAWRMATSPAISRVSRPGRLRRGVLEITVVNSALMQELTFGKKQILKSLNQNLEHDVQDLRFKLGSIDS